MCGVAGLSLAARERVSESSLWAAASALTHRGPDDSGVFLTSSGGVGLAHARLSIIDLSPLGHQPMVSDDGRVVLAFNGEIYNYRALRESLASDGHEFRGESDTEVLLHLYLQFRERGGALSDYLQRLNGVFAFAIWDADREALLLVRDGLGVKPLYYYEGSDQLAFASEIKALLPLVPSLGALDPEAIHRYLSFLWCPGEGTPARRVRKLQPGELLWVQEGKIAERGVWYRLPAFADRQGREPSGPALSFATEAIAGTAAQVRQAVHRQMVADVPVGAFLSGGLDSSAIVAFAREHNPAIRCFTIRTTGGGEEGFADDLPYAQRVAQHLDVPLDIVTVDARQLADEIESLVTLLDEPLADPAALNVLHICRRAREQGIKVLLSGAGGDDLFTGYRRHQALQLERWWSWLPMSGRKVLETGSRSLDQRRPLGRRLRKLFNGAALEGDERLIRYFSWFDNDALADLYTPQFRAAVSDAAAPMKAFLADLPPATSRLERMLALEQRFFLADHNLIYTDKMSMAAGVEVRVPLIDLELVEYAARLPARFKQRGAVGKWVLKKAMEPYLPKEVIYRPKTGFGVPLRRWIRHELRTLLGDILSEESLRRRGIFDARAVQRLMAANDEGAVDASYTLLSLLCVELWCRAFIDKAEAGSGGGAQIGGERLCSPARR